MCRSDKQFQSNLYMRQNVFQCTGNNNLSRGSLHTPITEVIFFVSRLISKANLSWHVLLCSDTILFCLLFFCFSFFFSFWGMCGWLGHVSFRDVGWGGISFIMCEKELPPNFDFAKLLLLGGRGCKWCGGRKRTGNTHADTFMLSIGNSYNWQAKLAPSLRTTVTAFYAILRPFWQILWLETRVGCATNSEVDKNTS